MAQVGFGFAQASESDAPVTLDVLDPLERRLAKALPKSLGCVVLPGGAARAVVIVRPAGLRGALRIVSDMRADAVVRVRRQDGVTLRPVRRWLLQDMYAAKPSSELIRVEQELVSAARCPRVAVVVDPSDTPEVAPLLAWANDWKERYPRSITIIRDRAVDD